MNTEAVAAAAQALRAGKLVAIPTETVYGLAADAGNAEAVAAVYALKQRPADHPLIVHVSDLAQARRWADFNEQALALAHAFWPGPLTLIARLRAGMPDSACAGHATVGLRVPSHPVAQALLRQFEALGGLGVAAPSANRFGRISPTRAAHVLDDYGGEAPLILEGGESEVGLESTICDVSGEHPAVLRPGAITGAAMAAVLGLPALGGAAADRPVVPGSLAAHYAPLTRLELLPAAQLPDRLQAVQAAGQRAAVYARQCPAGHHASHWIAMAGQPEALSRHLYDDLRRLDAMHVDVLLVEQPPADAAYSAINDRLGRARTGSMAIPDSSSARP